MQHTHRMTLIIVEHRHDASMVMSHSLTSSLYYYEGRDMKKASSSKSSALSSSASSASIISYDDQVDLTDSGFDSTTDGDDDGINVDAASKSILDELVNASKKADSYAVFFLFFFSLMVLNLICV
jgi:hypothetical protein